MRAPPPATVAALIVAILAVSVSGPLIAYAAAPALAIAFWRNALAVGVLVPVAAVRRRDELVQLAGRREGGYGLLAGVALAAHFGTWVPSTKLTTVATATALVATQPVWQGLISAVQGRHLPRRTWLGIAVAMAGALLATGADFGISDRAVSGDVLALAGGLFGALYNALGERVRSTTSTTTYTTVCYTACALLLGLVCLLGGVPLKGFETSVWLVLVALTIGPQLLGHSLFNFSLRKVSATTVSILLLLELPLTAFIGWIWLGQVPTPLAIPGIVLLVAGVAVVLASGVIRSEEAELTT